MSRFENLSGAELLSEVMKQKAGVEQRVNGEDREPPARRTMPHRPNLTLPAPPSEFDIHGIDAAALVESDMPEPLFLVAPWLCEGVTLVVGRPKIGKTTLLRQLAVACNTGADFLSSTCQRVRVLFLSLEEGERLMRSKLKRMELPIEALRGITMKFEWPQGAFGVEALRQWLEHETSTEEIVLVVIDSLQRFRDPQDPRGNAYAEDYAAVKMLADLAKERPGLALVLLHHTTKMTPEDPVAAISGTYGLTAAAENYLIVLRIGERFRLHAGGRTWLGEASDYELARAALGSAWELVGEWDTEVQALTAKQRAVLDVLRSGAKTRKDIAAAMGVEDATKVSHLLGKLQARNLVEPVANGWALVRQ